ncbi:trypsin-like serine peptidase [Streptosporangium canum]|uniref:trypsin-like serine peptidase n=1 Tax=Streptosporangium canum TaxID=324952 RepID=UPI00379EAACC
MTSSLPLLAGAALVAGLLGAPQTGATTTEHGRWAVSASRPQPVAMARPAAKTAVVADRDDVVERVAARGTPDQRHVLDYWTPRRMAAAVPIDLLGTAGMFGKPGVPLRQRAARTTGTRWNAGGSVTRTAGTRWNAGGSVTRTAGTRWNAGGSVTRTTGRVFLTLGGLDFVCSASSVRSTNKDLVVTAGHCVKDGTGAWADNWTFVPGYDRGRRPYGQFTARRMFVAGPWSRSADDSYDIGMVALNHRGGRHLGEVVGGQGIAFGTARGRQTHGFGFPAEPPYDGEHLVYCAGPVRDDPHGQTDDQGMRCDMTAGSSGGPWLSGFDVATGRGTITSVSSFKYSDDRGTMYGPYFGDVARELYTAAERS